jgi:ankyrin repeat protein
MKCKTGENEWCPGTVVGVCYHQATWEADIAIPYQVELDDGLLVYVPKDTDDVCQQIPKAWWETVLHARTSVDCKTMFDAPGQYLVVSNTMVQNQLDRCGATKIADANAPLLVDITAVFVSGDRVRGRVSKPTGWMSLRSVDNEKVFAVPTTSAFARRFRSVNDELMAESTDDDFGLACCRGRPCGKEDFRNIFGREGFTVATLVEHSVGQDIDERDEHGQTALMAAVKANSLEAIERLVQLRADVNLGDTCGGRTPLHFAVRTDAEVVKCLAQFHADPNIQTLSPELSHDHRSTSFVSNGLHQTPLHLAAVFGSPSIARALLCARANPNIRDAYSKVPLHVALENDSETVLDVLLEGNADVNMGNLEIGMKTTLLQDAACRNDDCFLKKLIAARAALNAADKRGMTALHVAISNRHEGIARELIAARCDTSTSLPCASTTVVGLATKNRTHSLMELLM